MNQNQQFLDKVKKIIYKILDKENVLKGEWHLGKVESVISPTQLKVFVDGSTTSQTVPCNPDVPFQIGDEIFVIFVNKDSKNKFALCRRGI